jgi:hypothetical protein
MNGFSMIRGHCLYFEIGTHSLKALDGQEGFELELERQPDGRLAPACKQKLTAALQQFVKRKGWQARSRAVCAIGASGVSLRRLSVPAAARDQFQRLLLLQIESAFPLPPAELAWGCQPLGQTRSNGSIQQELLVIAVRKEALRDYAEIFDACDLSPAFTLAALARSHLCRQPLGTCAVLDLAPGSAEAILFEQGVPASIRAFVQDGDDAAAARQMADFLSHSNLPAKEGKLFVSGKLHPGRELLEQRFSQVTVLEVPAGAGSSAAILGLKKTIEQEHGALLCLESKVAPPGGRLEPGAVRKWAVTAAALALILLLLPGIQALLLKPRLAGKLAAVQAQSGKLTAIDQELGFFEFLKQNQPPYLDALFICAKSAPPGAQFDSLTMNRRGEMQMRGSLRNADQVSEFRSKLIASGFFSMVSVEDQSPGREKVTVRIAAQWRPYGERASLALGPSESELPRDKPKPKN